MIVLHYGYHEGTTGVHFESALRRRSRQELLVKATRQGEHVDLRTLHPASAYVWVDSGTTSLPFNADGANCPTVGYLIDVHQHTAQRLLLAPLFDVLFIAQHDYLETFRDVNEHTSWLPLACPVEFTATERSPGYDLGFVGQARRGSRRERLLEALATKFTINDWRREHSVLEMGDVYRRSRVVVNDPINGDVNMRFFEAMGSGATVLSPRLENGISQLADAGRHYEVANFDDFAEVATTVERLASGPDASSLGAAGRVHVARHHTYDKRADVILEALKTTGQRAPIRSMTARDRARHLARIAESTASVSLGVRALASSRPTAGTATLFARACAKAVKRRIL
ncbi:MAG: hypothetical protein QOF21_1955 [Actinomycetota bacterium]|jgi:glycosyltransferase involved in cell wall biosynthesis